MAKPKITDKNLYDLLEILSSATEKEIKKAYRKKALKCHPDKNPDNPKAAELFHELSAALEILTDAKAREAYDRTLKAKELAKQRTKELDAKRRKLKEDLERREKEAKVSASSSSTKNTLSDEEMLQKEIERLQKEGSKALREEQELVKQQILKEQQGKFSYEEIVNSRNPEENNPNAPRIKAKWSSSASYDYDKIINVFRKYGKVNEVVVLKRSALVEFDNQLEADLAFSGESCVKDNPLKLEWISKHKEKEIPIPAKPAFPSFTNSNIQHSSSEVSASSIKSFIDFEALILGKVALAAAEQKKAALAKAAQETSEQNSESDGANCNQ